MINLRVKLYKAKDDGSIDYAELWFHPRNQMVLFEIDDIEGALNMSFDQIKEVIERCTQNGSGWIVDRVVSMNITIINL